MADQDRNEVLRLALVTAIGWFVTFAIVVTVSFLMTRPLAVRIDALSEPSIEAFADRAADIEIRVLTLEERANANALLWGRHLGDGPVEAHP